jgi:biotin carboxylase
VRILILSTTTGYQLRSFGEAAQKLGIELMFATDRCHTLDDPWQDEAVPVRFEDEETSIQAVRAAARDRPLDGVIAVGDRPVVLGARIARALDLSGNPPAAAAASVNKLLTRAYFAGAGLLTPWHFAVSTETDPGMVAQRASYPAVVKPIGLSGSRGVIRVNTSEELVAAFMRVRALLARRDIRALRSGTEGTILVEGFLSGREYAVEGLLTRGRFRPLTIFDKPDPLDGPFFEETVYVTPALLPAPTEQAIVMEVARACTALGLTDGPAHAECRLTPSGVFILEVAARPIGGLCSQVLRFGPDGEITLEELLLRHAAGESVEGVDREPAAAAVMMIPIPKAGILKEVTGTEAARQTPNVNDVRITAKPDQLLEPLPEAGSYLGFIFARGARPPDAEAAVRAAHRELSFNIEPAIQVNGVGGGPRG